MAEQTRSSAGKVSSPHSAAGSGAGETAAPVLGEVPVRPVTPAEFARIRELLGESGFRTPTIQRRRGGAVAEKLSRPVGPGAPVEPADAAEALIRLFVDGHTIPRAEVDRLVPVELTALLEKSGLLRAETEPRATLSAPMALYPTGRMLVVSDHWQGIAGSLPVDIVYPALSTNTVEFLKALPTGPCDAMLDIGAGTGIAALLGAARARHVWATDIAGRSRRVAEFNALLNGIANVTAVEGDLYAPVEGMTFDRIVSHPPYVPAAENRVIFRDGGEDGEQITRRIIAGLADHLRPGGRFYCRCMATDRRAAPLEQRVRQMLGPPGDAFDVLVVPTLSMQAGPYYCKLMAAGRVTPERVAQQLGVYERLGVVNVVIGFVFIVRHDAERPPFTVRRQLAGDVEPDPAAIEWLYEWERMSAEPGFDARLLESKPRLAASAGIEMSHRLDGGRLRAAACRVNASRPFLFALDGSPALALLFERCDGTRTLAELRRDMTEAGVVPAGTPVAEFLAFARSLIGGGVLEIAEHPIPDLTVIEDG